MRRAGRWLLYWVVAWTLSAGGALSVEDVSVRVDGQSLDVRSDWRGGQVVEVTLSDPTPYAIGFATDPSRLILRLKGAVETERAAWGDDTRLLPFDGGADIVLPLARPMALREARLTPDSNGDVRLHLELRPTDADTFATLAYWTPPDSAVVEQAASDLQPSDRALRIMLDPGHGGFDPGAEHGGVREADLVLLMAQLIRAHLERAGATVALTRDGDQFVALPERVARANRAQADVFVSLHADAVAIGRATGASVHSLPEGLGQNSNQFLLRQLGQDALSSTSDGLRDETTRVLIELARADTQEASASLAQHLVGSMRAADIDLYKTPLKTSNFVVLRAADMASVLVELGFLSDSRDRARLVDPLWRAQMAEAIAQGILTWSQAR